MIPDFATTFGGVGDGATSNNSAFASAEASAYERIWLPEGEFYTTRTASQFSKRYEGPGRIKLSSGGDLQGYAALDSVPAFGTVFSEYGETGDVHFSDVEYKLLRPGSATSLTNHYFQAGRSPKFARFLNQGGGSGTTAYLAASAAPGATQVTLNSVDDLAIGDHIGFSRDDSQTPLDTVTIAAINTSTKQITFTPALANSYTWTGADYVPTFLSGYSQAPRVLKGVRTNDPYQLVIASHQGEGDSYIWCGRMAVDYVPKAGQTDFTNTATGGLIGGDITLNHDGVYATGWECAYDDQGHDVAVVGSVNSYHRTNDAGARRVAWVHDFPKSDGTKPIEVFYSMSGASRVGIDFTLGDFSSEGQRAIQMRSQQRIYFDASFNTSPGQRARGFWGNVQGDSWLGHDSDGSGEFVDLWVGGQRTIRARPSSINFSQPVTGASSIAASGQLSGASLATTGAAVIGTTLNVGTHMSANGNLTLGGTMTSASDINAGGNLYTQNNMVLPLHKALYFGGLGSTTYLAFDGTTIFLFKNGSVAQAW